MGRRVRNKKKLCEEEQINHSLDVTNNVQRLQVEDFFPDLPLFLISRSTAMEKKASLEELEQTRRYRLKKVQMCSKGQMSDLIR